MIVKSQTSRQALIFRQPARSHVCMHVPKLVPAKQLQIKRLIKNITITAALCATLVAPIADVLAQSSSRVFYRYVNEDGVKVINYTIPPEFAQKGYEIISKSGKVIEVVEPAPPPEDLEAKAAAQAKAKKRAELLAEYRELKRRYSTVEDIDAAEGRKLDSINTNIAIQKGNIININSQIDTLMKQAADAERANRPVPEQILDSIRELENQKIAVEHILEQRYAKIKEFKARFELDREILRQGHALETGKPLGKTSNETDSPSDDLKTPPDGAAEFANLLTNSGVPNAKTLNCDKAIESALYSVENMIEVGKRNFEDGYLSQAEYERVAPSLEELKVGLSKEDCATSTGVKKQFYLCMSTGKNHIVYCGKKYDYK